MKDPVTVMKEAGWTKISTRRHHKWRCPCGEHQITFSKTPSDRRAYKNTLAEIRRTGCRSLERVEVVPETPWPVDTVLVCKFCGAELDPTRHRKDWVYHEGVCACLSHPGVRAWDTVSCREARARAAEQRRAEELEAVNAET